MTGPIVMKLFASTTAKDTDWTAKLVDVHPNGFAQNIQDGIIRGALPRIGRPGRQTNRVWKGVRVRDRHVVDQQYVSARSPHPGRDLEQQFPRFDRNLNTGDNPGTGTAMVKAAQTIHHSREYPSHIVLPVIPMTAPKPLRNEA